MINIYEGSILDVEGDAIVNPANSFLYHEGGLARIIDDAANGGMLDDNLTLIQEKEYSIKIKEYNDWHEQGFHVPTGTCVVGPPGALDYKAIIHVVAPIYEDGNYEEYTLMTKAFESIFKACREEDFKSVVIPAIGAGIFGNPIKHVAAAAYDAIAQMPFIESEIDITFALLEQNHIDAFQQSLKYYLNWVSN